MVHQVQEGIFGPGGIAGSLSRQPQFFLRAAQLGDVLVNPYHPLNLSHLVDMATTQAADIADFTIATDNADLLRLVQDGGFLIAIGAEPQV